MPKKRFYDGDYSGDSSMMSSGGGFANMPQGVIMKEYPKYGSPSSEGLNDTLSGIDRQVSSDSKGKKSAGNAEKY